MPGRRTVFQTEEHGPVVLSMQASHSHYCTPRTCELGKLELYEFVELGIFTEGVGRGNWLKPIDLGVDGWEEEFAYDDCVYAEMGKLIEMIGELISRYGTPTSEETHMDCICSYKKGD